MPRVCFICKLAIHEFAFTGYIRAGAIAVENRVARNLSLPVDLRCLASPGSANHAGCIPRGRVRGESAGRPVDSGVRAHWRVDHQQAHCGVNCLGGQAAGVGDQPLLYRHRLLERYCVYHSVPKATLTSNAIAGNRIQATEDCPSLTAVRSTRRSLPVMLGGACDEMKQATSATSPHHGLGKCALMPQAANNKSLGGAPRDQERRID